MKYLAFDIEAANGYKSYSVCSIGIVTADEDFNILSKRNVLINPKTEYNLNGTRKNISIDLHLDEEVLKQSPIFPDIYEEIKALLEDPEYVVMGHAVESDVHMLNAACIHYRLPSINYKYVCTQLMYKLYKNEREIKALNKIADDLHIEFNHHASDEDALMSLLTLKYLLSQTGLTLGEFIEQYKISVGENENYCVKRTVSMLKDENLKNMRKDKENELCDYVKSLGRMQNKELNGVVVAVSREVEVLETEKVKSWLKDIHKRGGVFTTKIGKCNVYLYKENPNPADESREACLRIRQDSGDSVLWIDCSDFEPDGLQIIK
ncbi:MAG: hypothetical protein PHX51_01870 [Clostridia bacterium]|nr:hypothetical protein [Clostridia bacterium]